MPAARPSGQGLGQKARVLNPGEPAAYWGGALRFEVAVSPTGTTYVTVRLWGDDYDSTSQQAASGTNTWRLQLFCDGLQVGYQDEGAVDSLDILDTSPRTPGRFFFHTLPLPERLTRGRKKVRLEIRSMGRIWSYGQNADQLYYKMTTPSRGIYRLYTHTEPYFVPPKPRHCRLDPGDGRRRAVLQAAGPAHPSHLDPRRPRRSAAGLPRLGCLPGPARPPGAHPHRVEPARLRVHRRGERRPGREERPRTPLRLPLLARRQGVNDYARIHHLTPIDQRSATIRQRSAGSTDDTYTVNDWILWDYAINDPVAGHIPPGGFPPPGDTLHQALAGDVHHLAPIPADVPDPALGVHFEGVETMLVGRAPFYLCEYGDYLIAMNTSTERTYILPARQDFGPARDLATGRTVGAGQRPKVGPRSTIVLYRGRRAAD